MKKIVLIALIAFTIVSCGPSAKELKEKAAADSIATADSIALVQYKADSIEKSDSVRVADSIAKLSVKK